MRISIPAIVVFIAAVAAAPVGAAELKIGVVHVQKLVAESPQAQKIQEKMQQEFAPRERELMTQQNELKGLQEKFQRDAQVMSESERSNMERRIRDLGRDLQFRVQSLREDAQTRQQEEMGKLQRELGQAVEAFAKAEGYDLILTDGVAFRKEALDVTDQVLKRINKK